MEILGIGPLEFIVILVILLIVLGPNDMAKAGRTLGKWFRQLLMSDTWKAITQTSKNIRDIPNRLAREASLEEFQNMKKDLEGEIKTIGGDLPNPKDIDKYKAEIEKEIAETTKITNEAVKTSEESNDDKNKESA